MMVRENPVPLPRDHALLRVVRALTGVARTLVIFIKLPR